MLALDCMKSYEVKRYKGSQPSSFVVANDLLYICYPDVCAILCFDKCFTLQEKIIVSGSYYSLCFDQEKLCFYALDTCYPDKIFILNSKFCEIDCISIQSHHQLFPNAIACCQGCIYVAYENYLVCISSKQEQVVCYQCDESISAITCTASSIALLILKNGEYEIRILSHCWKTLDCEKVCIDGCVYAIGIYECGYVLSKHEDDVFFITAFPFCQYKNASCTKDQATVFFQTGEIEKGIACVLNSEGMKIQYAIEQGASIKELLKINQSVIHVVNELTQLELSLYNRLCHCVYNDCGHHKGECE